MEAIEGEILMDDIDKFTEVGACGTAAVVAPIGSIYYKGKEHIFHSKEEAGAANFFGITKEINL